MEDYRHIVEQEKTLNAYEVKLKELSQLLDFFEENRPGFQALMDYYTSEQRMHDLEDDHSGRLPEGLHRGVLSEDLIYNCYSDYREQSIRMLEIATHFFKEV
ncbi:MULTISPECIES: DUF4298 domain-containing protein [Enterococcus]|uniref:DUF4298 domain-containing protein n=1 Tax=Enterococcus alcedinis TaxID=1274384 RepID=A0A917N4M6_9ENTE|nr:DUF4298 domain-containing protein [Enterococcus alcedinis]MBP2102357.1 hypothetical protein [Enterococcus alcedinis]GGI65915.1 hypothetical protein GCM10011482_15690 [Enterococcus alcedinis]